MLVALLIAAIPLLIIYRLSVNEKIRNKFLAYLSTGLIVFLLFQITLGTQVREQIDEISKSLLYQQRELWIRRLDKIFFIHRSLSWLVMAGCLLLFWKARSIILLRNNSLLILGTAGTAILVGVVMAYCNIPAWAQPLHLLLASILVLSVFTFRLKLK
jgi:cytochrome c oxidase assembly protein subunit 15